MTRDESSLEKGLILLKAIADDRGVTPFRDLAERMGIPLSTAHRLLTALRNYGFVSHVGTGQYDLGFDLALLAGDRSKVSILAAVARPYLDSAARQFRMTMHLGVLEEGMVTYVVKSDGEDSVNAADFTREGMQLEAYCSAVGRVLLAELGPSERDDYLSDGPFIQLTSRTVTDPYALMKILNKVSEKGYAEDDREIAENLWCLAVPVRSKGGNLVGAISVSTSWSPERAYASQAILNRLLGVACRIANRI